MLADGRKVLLNVRSSWNSQGKLEYSYILKITSSDDPEIEYKFNLNDEKGEYYSKDGVDIRFMPQIIGSIANDIEISKGLATGGVAESLVSEPMADYQEVFPTDGFVSETLDVGACHPTAGMVEIDGVGQGASTRSHSFHLLYAGG